MIPFEVSLVCMCVAAIAGRLAHISTKVRAAEAECLGTALHSVAYPIPHRDPAEVLTETSREQTITRLVSQKSCYELLKSKKSNSR